jgi:cytochrome o ubiquinol oxidase subunit 1
MGMTRRMQHYDVPLAAVAGGRGGRRRRHPGGIVCQVVQLVVSIRDREQLRDVTGDPWNGRTLEWSTLRRRRPGISRCCRRSHGETPIGTEAARARKQPGSAAESARKYEPIEMPKNSADRLHHRILRRRHRLCADLAHLVDGRSGLLGAFVTLLAFAFRDEEEIEIPAEQIARFDRRHQAEIAHEHRCCS